MDSRMGDGGEELRVRPSLRIVVASKGGARPGPRPRSLEDEVRATLTFPLERLVAHRTVEDAGTLAVALTRVCLDVVSTRYGPDSVASVPDVVFPVWRDRIVGTAVGAANDSWQSYLVRISSACHLKGWKTGFSAGAVSGLMVGTGLTFALAAFLLR